MPKNVRVEWRQGFSGLGNVYRFPLNPSPTRVDPALKQAEFDIPLSDGVEIQNLGRNKRIIQLKGTLYSKSKTFEELEAQRDALISGIGYTVGQLHFISLTNLAFSRHIFYTAQVTTDGIVFEEQTNPIFLEYTITLTCADPVEYNIATKTITSDAKVV